MWLELTRTSGHKVWINMDHIARFYASDGATMLVWAFDTGAGKAEHDVSDTPDQIMAMLERARD